MNEKNNLGRGLGDMMNEVSHVKAIPSQPAANIAEALASARNGVESEKSEPPAPETESMSGEQAERELNAAAETIVVEAGERPQPAVIEERPADADSSNRPDPAATERIVKIPFVPLWAKLAVVVLAGIIAALIVTLTSFRADLQRSENEARSLTTELQLAHAELAMDPLVWTENIRIKGLRVERQGRNAVVVFDDPFFASGLRWSMTTEQILNALLTEIAPHAGECYVTIVGHTGQQPLPRNAGYRDNLDLGLRRAEAVMDSMVRGKHWPVTRLAVRSDGEKYPPYPGDDILSQVRNRTVTFEIRPK